MFTPEQIRNPLRKLQKQLKRFPVYPLPEDVHALRTQIRRIEALTTCLLVDSGQPVRRLLKTLRPLRKAAGRVRDLDVLIANVLSLETPNGHTFTMQLLEHLAANRIKSTKTLKKVIVEHGDSACLLLTKTAKLVTQTAEEIAKEISVRESAPQILVNELAQWPRLDAENLHSFRIRVKKLRTMLQLESAANRWPIVKLSEVKDAIGEWHDWMELLRLARKVLGNERSPLLLKEIQDRAHAKLESALLIANSVRSEYFHAAQVGRPKGTLKGPKC